MRIECPSCQAAYEVPDAVLSTRRTLRCARCATDWSPPQIEQRLRLEADTGTRLHETPAASAEAPAYAEPIAVRAEPEANRPAFDAPAFLTRTKLPPPGPTKGAVLAAWTASVALLALMGWSAYAWRVPVMRAWPPSTRLYAAIGLA